MHDKNTFPEDINLHLKKQLMDEHLNFCHLIRAEKDEILSVIGRYDPCRFSLDNNNHKTFLSLDETLKVCERHDLSNFYYGVSPALDEQTIVQAISKGYLRNPLKLDAFIKSNHSLFMLHCNQKEYLLPFAKLITLSLAHNFGIRIHIKDSALYEKALGFSSQMLTSKGRNCNEIFLCGCPTDELFAFFSEYKFKKCTDYWDCVSSTDDGNHLEEIYSDTDNILLLNGHTFYSGALLKVLELKKERKPYGNSKVSPVCVYFERSSYATVFTLDNNFTKHSLLDDCYSTLIKMYREDDQFKRTLQSSTNIDAINLYLRDSHNVNQLGVTGNLITSDHILLLGLRSSGSIDSGALYPSVNGNAEVVDENVSFYKISAHEDYPEIRIDAPRIDFNGELNREAYAELGLQLNNNWLCHGITLSGSIPPNEISDEYTLSRRRMHLNIICEQICDFSFTEIMDKQERATESYENNSLMGLKISYSKNWGTALGGWFRDLVAFLRSTESYLTALIAIGVLFLNSFSITLNVNEIISIISTFLTVITLILITCDFISECKKKRKHIFRFTIIGSKNCFDHIDEYLSKYSSHPVTRTAIMCHIAKKLD